MLLVTAVPFPTMTTENVSHDQDPFTIAFYVIGFRFCPLLPLLFIISFHITEAVFDYGFCISGLDEVCLIYVTIPCILITSNVGTSIKR